MKVGFIGLGDMGSAMAARIAEQGHRLHLWARRSSSIEALARHEPVICESAAELAGKVDHLGLCVTSETDVKEVLIESGALGSMRPGSTVAVHATISPASVVELSKLAMEYGIGFIDAPVSGAREGAQNGELLVIAGGTEEDIRLAMPVLSTYASQVWHVGPVGTGQTAKILNNLAMNVNIVTAQLVLELGVSLGIDRAQLRKVILLGSGASRGLDALDRLVHPGAWSAVNGRKDLDLAADLLAEAGWSRSPLKNAISMARKVREEMAPRRSL